MLHVTWKIFKYGVFSGPYSTEYKKIRTRKNSVFGHSSCSDTGKVKEKDENSKIVQ